MGKGTPFRYVYNFVKLKGNFMQKCLFLPVKQTVKF